MRPPRQAPRPAARLPTNPSDLLLRMVNGMVDSYFDLRRTLSTELDSWQAEPLQIARTHCQLGCAADRTQHFAHAARPV